MSEQNWTEVYTSSFLSDVEVIVELLEGHYDIEFTFDDGEDGDFAIYVLDLPESLDLAELVGFCRGVDATLI